jgi:uncharacterized membrane protein YphA (DoxX/SURF4 family)
MSYLLLMCRAMVAGVFIVSLTSKIRSGPAYAAFRRSVDDWQVVPRRWLAPVAPAVVAGEAAVVLLLALPRTVPIGCVAAALLLSAFTVGISLVRRRRRMVTCQCFGASTTQVGAAHLVRNVLLLVLCVTGAVTAMTADGTQPTAAGALLTLLVAAAGVLIVVRLDDILTLTGK